MAVPRNRTSNARKNSRSSHMALKKKSLSACQNCQAACRPHHVCPKCGYYKERNIIKIDEESVE